MKRKITVFIIFITLVVILVMLISCNGLEDKREAEFPKNFKSNRDTYNYNTARLLAVLYHQKSAEYKAVCYQTFNIARLLIDLKLKKVNLERIPAIIVDVDETIIDNSPYEGKIIKDKKDYPYLWDDWCKKGIAQPLPGAVEFLNYAKSKSVEVFYITNRKSYLLEGTLKNLKAFNFPFADEEHILMRTTDNSKEGRRKVISSKYNVILLIGDNLADFSNVFENKSINDRKTEVDKFKLLWGDKFLILPNTMYGDWEGAIYNFNYELDKKSKLQILLNKLEFFN